MKKANPSARRGSRGHSKVLHFSSFRLFQITSLTCLCLPLCFWYNNKIVWISWFFTKWSLEEVNREAFEETKESKDISTNKNEVWQVRIHNRDRDPWHQTCGREATTDVVSSGGHPPQGLRTGEGMSSWTTQLPGTGTWQVVWFLLQPFVSGTETWQQVWSLLQPSQKLPLEQETHLVVPGWGVQVWHEKIQ